MGKQQAAAPQALRVRQHVLPPRRPFAGTLRALLASLAAISPRRSLGGELRSALIADLDRHAAIVRSASTPPSEHQRWSAISVGFSARTTATPLTKASGEDNSDPAVAAEFLAAGHPARTSTPARTRAAPTSAGRSRPRSCVKPVVWTHFIPLIPRHRNDTGDRPRRAAGLKRLRMYSGPPGPLRLGAQDPRARDCGPAR